MKKLWHTWFILHIIVEVVLADAVVEVRTQFVRWLRLRQVGGHESFGVGRSREGQLQRKSKIIQITIHFVFRFGYQTRLSVTTSLTCHLIHGNPN